MIIMDDDIIICDYFGGADLIRYIDENPDCCKLDLISGTNPRVSGFRYGIFSDAERSENYFSFNSSIAGIAFQIIRNLKKEYGKTLYFTDFFDKQNMCNTAHEDIVFIYSMMYEGMKIGSCRELIIGTDNNSTTVGNEETKLFHNILTINTKKVLKERFNIDYDIDRVTQFVFEKI